ncbi:MAG: ABC transporter permease [Chloroflexi bacterium]|nr:MAG: ABC transporter permease [Chloroflexota bacterium]
MVSHAEERLPEKSKGQQLTGDSLARFAQKNASQLGIIGVFIILWLFYFFAAPETFRSSDIYAAFMLSVPFFGIVALPLTMLIIAGEIDLSFPSIMAIGTITFIEVFDITGNVWLSFFACLLAGFGVGALNGLIVVKIGIPSLIATIGTQFFWRGMVLVVREGRSAVLVEPKNSALGDLLVGKINNFWPAQVIWFLFIAIVVWFLLNRHVFGAHVYLIGDNENSARLMGINVGRTKIILFGIVGVTAAFAGLLSSLQVANFFSTLGEGHLMTTLASVFLGGTSVFGGVGSVLGTFIASFIIGSINGGIVAVGLTGFYTQLIYGLIITASVAMHTILRKRLG